ncbi:hypothetical protein BDBG_02827 [Blastomyces gilchristii SLH14081]|uniref:Uncharacterized protein n=1 Tax=Blastomyces gilchristii (strain SLH14081) TaxID=559298 RepID=A0A179UI03_BLAGS|nr:uncharacterized protein BDBG_02827 [Blastomyces gilchristii SLH14081]OAT06651.1 hypothetical protein BDBG_02827 [Blastomyces gilchristii SLH14081]
MSSSTFSLKGLLLLAMTLGALANPLPGPKVGCVQCGPKTCIKGEVCCNESCGICARPGQGCTKMFCPPTPVKCGTTTCPQGEVCCNESCGFCTPPGGKCTEQHCEPAQCGRRVCPAGQVCCNSSCGICTPPGGPCTQQLCVHSYDDAGKQN